MDTSSFSYCLPPKLIAQKPILKRDCSKLMVLTRKNKSVKHMHFYDLADLLSPNDVLVLNNSKVFPARIFSRKKTGGKVEILLIKKLESSIWETLTKPRLKPNQKIILPGFDGVVLKNEDQVTWIKFNLSEGQLFKKLNKVGKTPLPPYIHSTQKEKILKKNYQTTYAKITGSAAAPTAGFHFTSQLLSKLKKRGVEIHYLTLHIGLGTFSPIKEKNLKNHPMHSEYFKLTKSVAQKLNEAKKKGKRIIAVGTTTARVLETAVNNKGKIVPQEKETNIFIYPPYKFKFVDSLITNFHLPKSTLVCLVSAFTSRPNTKEKFVDFKSSFIGKAYQKAIQNKYRFYSFGDSSFIQ